MQLHFKDDYSSGVHPGFTLPKAKRQKMSAEDYLKRKVNTAAEELNQAAAALVEAWKGYKRGKGQKTILNKKYIQTGFPFWDEECESYNEHNRNPYVVDWTKEEMSMKDLHGIVNVVDMVIAVNLCGDDKMYHEVLNPLHATWYSKYNSYIGARWELDNLLEEEGK